MFSGLGMIAIDDSGGLYFGGSSPAGYAFGVSNAVRNVSSFYDPNRGSIVIDANGDSQSPQWLPGSKKQAGPIEANAGYTLVSGDGPPAATAVAQTTEQTMGATIPKPAAAASIIPGVSDSILLLGGGALLLILLIK